jgi:serine protease Do
VAAYNVKFSEKDPRVGDWVLAVGNPFGLGGTVTRGIISAHHRDIGSGPYDYLQIDVAVNRGNSGGPSFNLDGEVVGMNTAIFSPSGGSVVIAFDVPAALVTLPVSQSRTRQMSLLASRRRWTVTRPTRTRTRTRTPSRS